VRTRRLAGKDERSDQDSDRDSRIRYLAYELWEQAGQPDGGAEDYWYQAERILAEQEGQGLREDGAAFEASAEEAVFEPAAGDGVPEAHEPDPVEIPPPAAAPARASRRAAAR